jgi:hypothetical protein
MVSMHRTREMAVSVSDVGSGKPVGRIAISLGYYYDMLGELFFTYDFRKPHAIRSETDEAGLAVIPMADYWGRIVLDAESKDWWVRFELNKELVRKGGIVEEKCKGRTIRLRLEPMRKATIGSPSGLPSRLLHHLTCGSASGDSGLIGDIRWQRPASGRSRCGRGQGSST